MNFDLFAEEKERINFIDRLGVERINYDANLLFVEIERYNGGWFIGKLITLNETFQMNIETTSEIVAEAQALSGAMRYALTQDIDATIYVSKSFYEYYKGVVILPNHETIDAILDLIYKGEKKHFRIFPVFHNGERYQIRVKRLKVAITPTEKTREIFTKQWMKGEQLKGEYV